MLGTRFRPSIIQHVTCDELEGNFKKQRHPHQRPMLVVAGEVFPKDLRHESIVDQVEGVDDDERQDKTAGQALDA